RPFIRSLRACNVDLASLIYRRVTRPASAPALRSIISWCLALVGQTLYHRRPSVCVCVCVSVCVSLATESSPSTDSLLTVGLIRPVINHQACCLFVLHIHIRWQAHWLGARRG